MKTIIFLNNKDGNKYCGTYQTEKSIEEIEMEFEYDKVIVFETLQEAQDYKLENNLQEVGYDMYYK